MTKLLSATLVLLAFIAGPLSAQTYPSQSETTITDDAEMLDPVEEAELAARLTEIAQERDVDVALVTLISTSLYTAGDDVDLYARNLIENWELGATTDGRAVIMLVFRDDQELAVEVTGLDGDPDTSVQEIIDTVIVPAFSEDDILGGMTAGFNAIDAQLLDVQTAPETISDPAPATSETTSTDGEGEGGGNGLYWIGGGIAAAVAGIVGLNKRAAAKLAATPCPSCGQTGLTRERVTIQDATEKYEGRGEVRTSCPSCGHVTAEEYTISRREPEKMEKTDKTKGKSTGKSMGKSQGKPKGGGDGGTGSW